MKKAVLSSAFLITALTSLPAFAGMPGKFFEVSPGIYRSAQPNREDLQDLKAFGIKTIINLNDDEQIRFAEDREGTALGLRVISQPMSGFFSPDDRQVMAVLAILKDPANYPVLVHCQHGEDRTGLIVGLHRVFTEGWAPVTAYREMLARGFHKILVYLNRYYKDRTGLHD